MGNDVPSLSTSMTYSIMIRFKDVEQPPRGEGQLQLRTSGIFSNGYIHKTVTWTLYLKTLQKKARTAVIAMNEGEQCEMWFCRWPSDPSAEIPPIRRLKTADLLGDVFEIEKLNNEDPFNGGSIRPNQPNKETLELIKITYEDMSDTA